MGSVRGKTAVLIAELDSEWGDWLASLRCEADDVVVLLQRGGERASAFSARVRARLAELHDGELVAAALVGGEHFDHDVLASRSLIARAVVSQMGVSASAGARLFLDGGVRSGRGRHAMKALADVVDDQVAHGVVVYSSGVEALRAA